MAVDPQSTPPKEIFPDTRWSVVARAGGAAGSGQDRASAAWPNSARCIGFHATPLPEGAAFPHTTHRIEPRHSLPGDLFQTAEPDKGKLRSYLLGGMKRFLAGEWRRESAEKRGGTSETFSIDQSEGEEWMAERKGGGVDKANTQRLINCSSG